MWGADWVWVYIKMGGRGEPHPISHVLLPALVTQEVSWKLSYGGKSHTASSDPAHSNTTLYIPAFLPLPPCHPPSKQPLDRKVSGSSSLMRRFSGHSSTEPRASPAAAPRFVSPARGSPGLSGNHVSDYMGNETRALFVCASD